MDIYYTFYLVKQNRAIHIINTVNDITIRFVILNKPISNYKSKIRKRNYTFYQINDYYVWYDNCITIFFNYSLMKDRELYEISSVDLIGYNKVFNDWLVNGKLDNLYRLFFGLDKYFTFKFTKAINKKIVMEKAEWQRSSIDYWNFKRTINCISNFILRLDYNEEIFLNGANYKRVWSKMLYVDSKKKAFEKSLLEDTIHNQKYFVDEIKRYFENRKKQIIYENNYLESIKFKVKDVILKKSLKKKYFSKTRKMYQMGNLLLDKDERLLDIIIDERIEKRYNRVRYILSMKLSKEQINKLKADVAKFIFLSKNYDIIFYINEKVEIIDFKVILSDN